MSSTEELKYPIKYAVMKIEDDGFLLDVEEKIVSNIASKCYVVGVQLGYTPDGVEQLRYEVVFPYQKRVDEICKVTPEYYFNYRTERYEYRNARYVTELFDSFEEAVEKAGQENKSLLDSELGLIALDENYCTRANIIEKEYQKYALKYKKIEEMIEENVTDMIVTESPLTKEKVFVKK